MTDNSIIKALQALHKAIAHRTTMPFDEFVEHLRDFDIYPIRDRGEVIGAVMTRGNEIHLGVTRTPEGAHLRELRSILAGIIMRHGTAKTAVMHDNLPGIAFCRRIGFEETHMDERGVHFELKEFGNA